MTMKVRGLLSLVVAAAAMWLTSCGHYNCGATFGNSSCTASGNGLSSGTGSSASGIVFAYLLAESHTSAPGMAADELDLSTNTFQDLGTTFAQPTLPTTLGAVDGGTVVVNLTSQRYLYVPFDDGTVYGYAIDGTAGALTAVPGIPFFAAGGTSIAVDPAGRFLFVSDAAGGQITAFTINASNGSLTSAGAISTGIVPAQMSTDGQGKFLYAAEGVGGVRVAAFAINQTTGALTATVPGSPFSLSLAQIEGEKSGKFLLGISEIDSHIHVLGINSTSGAIAEVSGSPFTTVAAPLNIVVHPTGSFVYAVNGSGTAMEGYQINATSGALTAVSGSPFTTVMLDVGEFDQSGLFFFGQGVGSIGATFAPYPTDTTTGVISATTFQLLGFPGGGFAVSDLNTAP